MMSDEIINNQDTSSQKNIALAVYLLQGLAFFVGITYIIAVVLNYIKKDDAKNTWLESHFKWQIRTFWFSVLWFVIGIATVMLYIGSLIILVNAIWVIYRIIKGWLRLNDNRPMYD
jgi:uncharacterized membrane protein